VLLHGGADAGLVASMVHFGTHSIGEMKAYLCEHGVPVRL
jgi:imidazole glycerol-phosphate synthase subunit HisF